MTLREKRTILSIDPTTRGLAYAVFERGELFDWGRSERGRRYDETALLDRLIGHYAADILVLEDPDAEGCLRRERAKALLRGLRDHAAIRRLPTKPVARENVRAVWRRDGYQTSEAIAAAIAEMFPELRPLVPRARRPFMPEDERVRVFGAIALLLAASRSFPPRLAS